MLIKEEYIMLDPRDTLQNLKQHSYRIEFTLKRGELLTFIGQVFTYFALNNTNITNVLLQYLWSGVATTCRIETKFLISKQKL